MSDYSPYIGYTITRVQTLLTQVETAYEALCLGKTVQRVGMGDMSVAFANGNLKKSDLESTLSALRAALRAAQASADGLVPAPRPARPVFPWPG